MRVIIQLVVTYTQGFKMWMGPIKPLVVLCHPDLIRNITSASGTLAELVVVGALNTTQGFQHLHLQLPCTPCRSLGPPPLFSLSYIPLLFMYSATPLSSSTPSTAVSSPARTMSPQETSFQGSVLE